MFNGYLSFAGTEIANSARTRKYVETFLPTFGLEDAHEDDDLACILGDAAYNSPATDGAPWYSANRPESAGFYGFYPLSIVGIEDSSRTAKSTELVGDGAIVSLPRYQSKQFRVQGLLLAKNQASLQLGRTWLGGALEGSNCSSGDCTGDAFCYLAYLPECCDYNSTDFPDFPLNESPAVIGPEGWSEYADGSVTNSVDGVLVSMPCGNDGAMHWVHGLIPGQAYRVQVEMASSAFLTLEVGGLASISARRNTAHFPGEKTPWVLDFVATQKSVMVRVTPTSAACDDVEANIYSILVERTPEVLTKSMPRFSVENTREPSSWTFDATPVSVLKYASVAASGAVEALTLTWKNSSGSLKTLAAGSGVQRIVRGLTAGQRYVTYINGAFGDSQAPTVTVDGATDQSTASLGDDWYAVSFTATSPQHLIHLKRTADVNIADGASVLFTLWYMRTEFDAESAPLPEPDQSIDAIRTMYQVTLLEGPAVVEEFNKSSGAMVRVEFTMQAAHPFSYSAEKVVAGSPSATVGLVPETSCSYGQPVRENLFTNPMFAGGTLGATSVGGINISSTMTAANVTPTTVAANAIFPTVRSMKLVAVNATTSLNFLKFPEGVGTFVAGHTYTVSADIGVLAVPTGAHHAWARRIVIVQDTGNNMSEQHPPVIGKSRVSVTFTSSGNSGVRVYHGGAPGDTDVFVSNVLIEESGASGDTFSGASAGGSWAGTANASVSIWAKTGAALIVDPDCPPIPDPPGVPGIDQACAADVAVWRRYPVEIPASFAGGWKTATPTVRFTTGVSVVRSVRVRFYANPFSRPIDDLNPCDYCGEFFISYIPANTTMTVNGILRRIFADVAGTGEQGAANLVSNSDGGPIIWPALACDIPYVMVVDISPEEVLDLDVQLSISRKE